MSLLLRARRLPPTHRATPHQAQAGDHAAQALRQGAGE